MVGSMPSPVLLGEEGVLLVLLPNLPKLAPDREHVPLGGEEEPLSLGAIQHDIFWLEFYIGKPLEFWLEIPYTKKKINNR